MITAMSLPFLAKKPIDLPPIVSVELIQITDKTNIPFAPKAKKTIEKIKKEEKKLVSEQAPPKKVKKIKPDSVPMPDDKLEKVEKIKEDKQNPEKIDNEVKQVSEFEKEELFDPNNIAALIDKSKIESAETTDKTNKVTQDQQKNIENSGLSLSEEDALKAQIFGCWSIPLGLPYNENLLVTRHMKSYQNEYTSNLTFHTARQPQIMIFFQVFPDTNSGLSKLFIFFTASSLYLMKCCSVSGYLTGVDFGARKRSKSSF